ncbi:MAG: oligopeptide/dipeptide ABC transporter ATP-binding protein, partial [Candidatus Sedimenticola endophacoides]
LAGEEAVSLLAAGHFFHWIKLCTYELNSGEFNLAYMFITHDLATVRSIADEVVVMKEGRIVEQGPKDEMFTPPHHPYTDLLLSSVPEMDPEWLTTVLEGRGVDNIGEAALKKQ